MQGREKGQRKLSKKEKEALEKEKAEEERRKKEEKERRREEKLLGIKPDRNEKKEKPINIEELEKEDGNEQNDQSKGKGKNAKKNQKKEKKEKKEKKMNQKKEEEENEMNEIEENGELEIEKVENNDIQQKDIVEQKEQNGNEEFTQEDDEYYQKKPKKQQKKVVSYQQKQGKIQLKELPKDVRKKGVMNDEEKLDTLFQYFNQWNDLVDLNDLKETSKYPMDDLTAADSRDLNQIIEKINMSKRKQFIKTVKSEIENDSSISFGKLCLIENLCLITDQFEIKHTMIDIHLVHFLIDKDCYKAYTLFLLQNSVLNEFPIEEHKEICTHLLTSIKKNKNPQSVSLKAFQKAQSIEVKTVELKEYYDELTDMTLLLNNKVSNKIFEYGLKQSKQLAYEMIKRDEKCYRHWDEIIMKNLNVSIELLKLIKSSERMNDKSDSSEVKLFASRVITLINEKNMEKTPEIIQLLSLCEAILKKQMEIDVKKVVGIAVVVGIIAFACYFLFMKK